MYYPKQLPYLLDEDFRENIEYKEYSILELAEYCMCIWSMQSKRKVDKTIYNYILPDACIDIVIDFENHSICFAGFSKETISFPLNKTIDYMGVRLKPGSFYTLFGLSADQVMDKPISFFEVEEKSRLEQIWQKNEPKDRIQIIKLYLLTKIKEWKNPVFIKMIDEIYENPKITNVSHLAQRFGYDRRHLFRLFKKYYGISPQVLVNILRLHLCLTLLLKNKDITVIMEKCGFYDQAHFIKEIKKYTGFSPLKLVQKYKT